MLARSAVHLSWRRAFESAHVSSNRSPRIAWPFRSNRYEFPPLPCDAQLVSSDKELCLCDDARSALMAPQFGACHRVDGAGGVRGARWTVSFAFLHIFSSVRDL